MAKIQNQRWLWHAIDHHSGEVLAYVLAPHEDEAFLKLKQLLEPLGIIQWYTDNPENNAWAQFESSQISLDAFDQAFAVLSQYCFNFLSKESAFSEGGSFTF